MSPHKLQTKIEIRIMWCSRIVYNSYQMFYGFGCMTACLKETYFYTPFCTSNI